MICLVRKTRVGCLNLLHKLNRRRQEAFIDNENPIGKSNFRFKTSPLDGNLLKSADFVFSNPRVRKVNKKRFGHSSVTPGGQFMH